MLGFTSSDTISTDPKVLFPQVMTRTELGTSYFAFLPSTKSLTSSVRYTSGSAWSEPSDRQHFE